MRKPLLIFALLFAALWLIGYVKGAVPFGFWKSEESPAAGGGFVLTNNLLAAWAFDESSGTSAADFGPSNKLGTLTNAPSWVAGVYNNSLKYVAASSQAVGFGNIGMSSLAQCSISAWIRRTAVNGIVWVGDDVTSANRMGTLVYSDGKIYITCGNGLASYGHFASNDTNWHHVVSIFNGSLSGTNRLIAYLDGSYTNLTYVSTLPSTLGTLTDFRVGRSTVNSVYSDGYVDSVRVYNIALTAGDVTTLYTNQ